MAFANKHWLYAAVLVVLLCVSVAIFLLIQGPNTNEIPRLSPTTSKATTSANTTSDPISVDLQQKKLEMQAWSVDFLNRFPDVPAAEALVDSYRELLDRVIDRNAELQEKGYSKKARVEQLTRFAENIVLDIEERTHSGALHMQLMRENPKLKTAIDRYTHTNEMFPLPLYLFRVGINPHDHEHE